MALTKRERERERGCYFFVDRRGIMIGARLCRFGKIRLYRVELFFS
jgi:hypothetical protein